MIFLLDSDRNSSQPKFWEYICDSVIRIDSELQSNYFIRTIEIEKIRYNDHVQGKQILKIQPGLKDGKNNPIPAHSHPYRNEGGIFVYPSIHYYLSYYKKHLSELNKDEDKDKDKSGPTYVKLYPDTLNQLISGKQVGLIPEGRCTAFIGKRGGHKSHLGYLFQLHQMICNLESSLVISLRDDETMTRSAMKKILSQEESLINKAYLQKLDGLDRADAFDEASKASKPNLIHAEKIINWFEKNGRLEILYYHPGYITPEEFCHRMFMSIHHIQHDGRKGNVIKDKKCCKLPKEGNWDKLTVMFNSLDQLTSRFPLCTIQDIFVPGLIDILNGEKITSIFVAVNSIDQPLDQFGLLPMADLILSFNTNDEHPLNEYYSRLLKSLKPADYQPSKYDENMKKKNTKYEFVEVEIERFAGGEKAGSKGTLELINSEEHVLYPLYGKTGLFFNQIYKDHQMRKYKRTGTNIFGNIETNEIMVKNISRGGILFESDFNRNISARVETEISFASTNDNYKGTIKWCHDEDNYMVGGFEFAEPLSTDTEKSLLSMV